MHATMHAQPTAGPAASPPIPYIARLVLLGFPTVPWVLNSGRRKKDQEQQRKETLDVIRIRPHALGYAMQDIRVVLGTFWPRTIPC